ncbi:hypothetical protein BC629DRAFT_1544982 [Irpex lacteus]|nr:hypothetical protein BC629DRAFT_1544982 [Irpex lacteus]
MTSERPHRTFRHGSEKSCPAWCTCERCTTYDANHLALFADLDRLCSIKNITKALFTTFTVRFLYNVFSRPTPEDMVAGLVADTSQAASFALSIVILGPFSLGRWIFIWLFQQFVLFIEDCTASLGFVLLLLRVAVRLGGALVLWIISSTLYAVFIAYPLRKFSQFLSQRRNRNNTNTESQHDCDFDCDCDFDELMQEALHKVLHQRLAEARAQEERQRKGENNNARATKGRRKGRRPSGSL